jgi:tetratricopeptide (TPR) repeat protein
VKKIWPLILTFFIGPSVTATGGTTPYVVEGLTLGEQVPLDSPVYRSYSCKPSDNFDGYVWCQRLQTKSTSAGRGFLSTSIMHAQDGTAIYLMANIAPVSIDRNLLQREIEDLSREIKERPAKIEWTTPSLGSSSSVIALWGQIELQALTPDEVGVVAAGGSPRGSVLIDRLGDLVRSAKTGLPIYRISGGPGYLYSASFDESGRGHRHYVAADFSLLVGKRPDAFPPLARRPPLSLPEITKLEAALRTVVQEDRSRPSDDYGLWPKVALIARNLSLETSPSEANQILDKVFDSYHSTKLRSHVWPLLPLGSIQRLANHKHWTGDYYREKTQYPQIRADIQRFLVENPTEPFNEFLFYTIGDLDRAMRTNPNSVISDVFRYAKGHEILASLLEDAAKAAKVTDIADSTYRKLSALNAKPEHYDYKPLANIVPNFPSRAAAAKSYFESVLREESSPHRDDAAYMLGWLALHQGNVKEAIEYMSQAMAFGNHDYQSLAIKQTERILERLSPRNQIETVASNRNLARQASLWYFAARSAYRNFDYTLAMESGERGLSMMNIQVDRLPDTTDPERIDEALEKLQSQEASISQKGRSGDYQKPDDVLYDGLFDNYGHDLDETINLGEIVYLINASRQMQQYEASLKSTALDQPNNVAKRARAIITRYSMLVDKPEEPGRQRNFAEPSHKDLRQAAHLVDITLNGLPMNWQYAGLREWLFYRRVRILVQFDPKAVPAAVAAMEREFPKSQLMDDALAEQVFAEGIMMRDVRAAQRTFKKLIDTFPGRNAIDNAYSWMAIIYRCERQFEEAQSINREIIQRFPLTRHAAYAVERLSAPNARNGCRSGDE